MNSNYRTSLQLILLMLVIEGVLIFITNELQIDFSSFILMIAFTHTLSSIILSSEIIREVKDSLILLLHFFFLIVEYIIFFAFQYWFLSISMPNSFTNLDLNVVDLFFHSTMIFIFNPLLQAEADMGKILILINIFGSMALILFVLQNMWHFKK